MANEEKERLQSVAMQNDQSILIPARRAEEEMLQAKQDLEATTRELARSNEILLATLESTSDGILVTDEHGRAVHVNENYLMMWRISRGDLERRDLFQPSPEMCGQLAAPERYLARLAEIRTDSPAETIDLVEFADGRMFELFTRAQLVEGVSVGRVWIFRDITERKRAEKEHARFAALVMTSEDVIISKTLDGIITSWNEAAEHLLGYSAAEAIGQSILMLIPPELHSEEEEILRRLRKGQRIQHFDTVRVTKSGERIDVSISTSPIRDPNGRILGGAKIMRDIRGQKKLEVERERLLAYERSIRAEAEKANRQKDIFLATLSHELRTPLSAALGWTTILRQQAGNDELREGLEIIERNCRAQASLIEEILDVSRIVSGKLVLNLCPCRLPNVIDAAADVVRHSAEAKGITLAVDHAGSEVGEVVCDPVRMQQVVWNLLTNSVKFTPPQGRIRVSLERHGSSAGIVVSDSGQGFAPGSEQMLFEPFQQAEMGSKRRFGGLGLGLSIVKHLVELHGGKVTAQSSGEGKGSVFTVLLPVRAVRPEEDEEIGTDMLAITGTTGVPASLAGVRVLVVDDEPDARHLVAKVLGRAGASVTTASSTKAALDHLSRDEFHVLVSDLAMPEQDGYDLIRSIRSLGHGGRELPAIALTAFASKRDEHQALLAGFQIHMSKPAEPAELVSVVGSLARRARHRG